MPTKTLTATVVTPVRNGVSSTPSGYDVGGPGSGSNYNNSIYMTFPAFNLPAGSVINSATLNYQMIGWDWKAAITIYVACATGAGTPSNQVPIQGTPDQTNVPYNTLVHEFAATNTARKMLETGYYYLKMYAPNGENRKKFTNNKPTLTINYSEPSIPSAPANVYVGDTQGATGLIVSEGNQTLRWNGAAAGTLNPITGYHIYRAEYNASGGLVFNYAFLQSVSSTSTSGSITVSPPSTRGNYYKYRVYTIGTYSNSGHRESTNGLQRQPTTVCSPPTSISLSSAVSDEVVTLSWSGAAGGYGNDIVGYDVDCRDSSDGVNWGAWTDYASVPTPNTATNITVNPPSTRGYYRQFRVRTVGSAGSIYYSSFKESGTLRKQPYTPVGAPTQCYLDKTYAEESAILHWNAGTDGYDNPVSGYDVMQSDDGGTTWTLHKSVSGKDTLSTTVTPRANRGDVRMFAVVTKGTATGIGSGDSPRIVSSNTLTKNRLPNKVTSQIAISKHIVIPSDILRVSFTNAGDADGNLAGYEVAMKDSNGNWYGGEEPVIVASRAGSSINYVDIDTTGWNYGTTWRLFVRGYDSEGARGEWSNASPDILVGAVVRRKNGNRWGKILIRIKYHGVWKYVIPWVKHNGTWKRAM